MLALTEIALPAFPKPSDMSVGRQVVSDGSQLTRSSFDICDGQLTFSARAGVIWPTRERIHLKLLEGSHNLTELKASSVNVVKARRRNDRGGRMNSLRHWQRGHHQGIYHPHCRRATSWMILSCCQYHHQGRFYINHIDHSLEKLGCSSKDETRNVAFEGLDCFVLSTLPGRYRYLSSYKKEDERGE